MGEATFAELVLLYFVRNKHNKNLFIVTIQILFLL